VTLNIGGVLKMFDSCLRNRCKASILEY